LAVHRGTPSIALAELASLAIAVRAGDTAIHTRGAKALGEACPAEAAVGIRSHHARPVKNRERAAAGVGALVAVPAIGVGQDEAAADGKQERDEHAA
jgi:hypothetical protein